MADEDDVFGAVLRQFFDQKTDHPLLGFCAGLAPGEAKVIFSLAVSDPDIGVIVVQFGVAQPFNTAIVDFIQPGVNLRLKLQLPGNLGDGLEGALVAADVNR